MKPLNKDTIARLLGHFWETPQEHVKEIVRNPLTPMGQAAVATAFLRASIGDLDALKFILERAIGKVPDKLEAKVAVAELPTREEAILQLTKGDYAVLEPARVEVEEL